MSQRQWKNYYFHDNYGLLGVVLVSSLLPHLSEHDVSLAICGGMGPRALELFEQRKIKIITGAPIEAPEDLVAAHFADKLKTTVNSCNH
ncbi:MAG: NifB/NifX family molybdenum-iron cluster-binding protein [Alphaproteobacteria bacterium]|nr:NifB/NifX family molybdenum-iron cluster-binding protein [Alphaproteobacteria bacterium]